MDTIIKKTKYIPAAIMRKMTVHQLRVICTQKNSRGKYSTNANNAQKILYQNKNVLHRDIGSIYPLTMMDKGWSIPLNETVNITEWLNGTENLNLLKDEV